MTLLSAWKLILVAAIVILCVVPAVSAAEIPQYRVGDIVYTGTGDMYSEITSQVVIVTSIVESCLGGTCHDAYYRYERVRLVPYPEEWIAPGGFAYSDPVFIMEMDRFDERYPVLLQHTEHVFEHSFRAPFGAEPRMDE